MLKNIHASIERFLLSPAYFLLFSIYPVLTLYVHNVHGVLAVDVLRPLGLSLFFAFLLFHGLQRIFHHSQTSALLVFLIYFGFFNYGDFGLLLGSLKVVDQVWIMAVIWLFVLMLLAVFIARGARHWNVQGIAPSMNLLTIILLLFPVIRLLNYMVVRATPLERKVDHTAEIQLNSNAPDIYYIILDAYTRSDILMEDYEYDNSPFIEHLQQMGFYVAECSQSNYGMTSLSLSASLNMDYLQNISDAFQPEEGDLLYAIKALEPNALRSTLTKAGYDTDVFASGFTWIEWRNADHFMSPKTGGVSEFEIVILLSSYARILHDFGMIDLNDLHAEHYRQRTRFVLDSFDELAALPSPKFVFVHIIAPHEPFGLDKDGNNISPSEIDSRTGYKNQSQFISSAIIPRLEKLIDDSATPPVIILQGDHGNYGSGPERQMKILNAYYLPGHMQQLYPSISPVNTFRVVLNAYFGTDFPLLEDVSYYSTLSRKYDFTVVPNTCR